MITADFTHCPNIKKFYEEIKKAHQQAHGEEYVEHHKEIQHYLKIPMMKSRYRELGVMQGATAAAALVAGAEQLHLIDTDMSRFKPYRWLFNSDTQSVIVEQKSSLDFDALAIPECDVLLVDTLHNPDHVKRELDMHSLTTTRAIIIHDTFAIPSIQHMVERWVVTNSEWSMAKYFKVNVGYTLLLRKIA